MKTLLSFGNSSRGGGSWILGAYAALVVAASAQTPAGGERELHVVALSQAGAATVVVDRPGHSIVLFLSAYSAVAWTLQATPETRLERVIVGGYDPGTVQGVLPETEVIPYWFARRYGQYLYLSTTPDGIGNDLPKLHAATGLEISSFQTASPPYAAPIRVDTVQTDPRLRTDSPQPTPPGELPSLNFSLAYYGGDRVRSNVFRCAYTLAGAGADAPLFPDALRFEPAGGTVGYGLRWDTLLRVDSVTGDAAIVPVSSGVPAISWAMGLTYDSVRQQVVVVTMGGEGYLYAYHPAANRWETLASLQNRDLAAMVYHAANDQLYALGNDRQLHRYSPAGAYGGAIALPSMPFHFGLNNYRAELVSLGEYLVLLVEPSRIYTAEFGTYVQESRMYLIDPRSGQVWLTYRRPWLPVNKPPIAEVIWPENLATLTGTGTLRVGVTAPDPDGLVDAVEILADGAAVGRARRVAVGAASDHTFAFDWTNASPGLHELTARATDAQGATTLSAPVQVTLDPALPPPPEPGGELHVIGLSEGGSISVLVNRPGKRVTLCLSCYSAAAWNVSVGGGTTLESVILAGYHTQSVSGLSPSVPVVRAFYEGGSAPYFYTGPLVAAGQFLRAAVRLHELTGMELSSFQGGFSPPGGFVVDRVQADARLRAGYPQALPPSAAPALAFQLAFYSGTATSGSGSIFLRNYTQAGPMLGSESLIPGLRAVTDGEALPLDDHSGRYYTVTTHEVLAIKFRTGAVEVMQVPPELPPVSWPTGTAFDPVRNRVLLATGSGLGYLYAYAPVTRTWSVLTNVGSGQLDCLVYHPAQDALYGVAGNYQGSTYPVLYRFSADGAYVGEWRLPLLPSGIGHGEYDAELASAGDYLVLLLGPSSDYYSGSGSPRPDWRLYVIDPRTGQTWLTYRRATPPANQPPTATLVAPNPGASYAAGDPIYLAVAATDPDGLVQSVEFYADGERLGRGQPSEDPYDDMSFTLTWTNAAPGDYTVTALVTDQLGAFTITESVRIVVRAVVPVITVEPEDADRVVGQSVTFTAAAIGEEPLTWQWFRDTSMLPEATNATLTLVGLRVADSGPYHAVVANGRGSATTHSAQLAVHPVPGGPGALDRSYAVSATWEGQPSGCFSLAPDHQGRLLVTGHFDAINGAACTQVARLLADGQVDPAFHFAFPAAELGQVTALLVQRDGRILVAGTVDSEEPQARCVRLLPDGSLDPSFAVNLDGDASGVALAEQSDGCLLVTGRIGNRNGVFRFTAQGALDTTFVAEIDPFGSVRALRVLPDDRVLVGGLFTDIGGFPQMGLARLNAEGTVDPEFLADGVEWASDIVVQPDGKLLVAGSIWRDGVPMYGGLVRLLPNGLQDDTFARTTSGVEAIALQPDGRILIGGNFCWAGGLRQEILARLLPNGLLDVTFNPEPGIWACDLVSVTDLVLQGNGDVVIAGSFHQLEGEPREGLARVYGGSPVDPRPTPIVTWPALGLIVYGMPLGPQQLCASADVPGTFVYDPPAGTILDAGYGQVLTVQFLPQDADRYRTATATAWLDVYQASVSLYADDKVKYAGQPNPPLTLTCFGLVAGETLEDLEIPPVVSTEVTRDTPPGSYAITISEPFDPNYQFGAFGGRFVVLAPTNDHGNLDITFDPTRNGAESGFDLSSVMAVAVQPDGRILVGGAFQEFNGIPCNGLVRLFPDGSLDAAISPISEEGWLSVNAIALAPDGKIVIAFEDCVTDPGSGRRFCHAARLNPDFSFDLTFDTAYEIEYAFIYAVAVQADGKVLLGGVFGEYAGLPYRCLARLNPDGSADTSFQPVPLSTDGEPRNGVNNIVVQPDGRILALGGFCSDVPGARGLVRLAPDGTVETNFAGVVSVYTENSGVLVLQPDGKIVLAADLWGTGIHQNLGRLNPDGSWDATFHPPAMDRTATALTQLPDGSFLVALREWGTVRVLHLEPDGALRDTIPLVLNLGESGSIETLAAQADGKAIVGGRFFVMNDYPISNVARIEMGRRGGQFVQRRMVSSVIHLTAAPAADVSVYAVEDQPPAGWGVREVSHGGVFDVVTGKVKFGPFYDHERRELSYVVLPPPGAQGVFAFTGSASADGLNSPVGGDQYLVFPAPIARTGPGSLDSHWYPRIEQHSYRDIPYELAIQPDGRLLIAGEFDHVSGVARDGLARLLANGELDVSFANVEFSAFGAAYAIATQPDGCVVIGGYFTTLNGVPRTYLARLQPDGTLDPRLHPVIEGPTIISSLALQSDGRILAAGLISGVEQVVRFEADGTQDTTFVAELSPGAGNLVLAVQPDDRIVVGGLNGELPGVVRLNANGGMDESFRGVDARDVSHIRIQPDGAILIAGWFSEVNGVPCNGLARLGADGILDTRFAPQVEGRVSDLALAPDGRILVVGSFERVGGVAINRVARLHPDGTLDGSFDPGAGPWAAEDTSIDRLALQPNGKMVIAGTFYFFDGVPRLWVARLNGDTEDTFHPADCSPPDAWLRIGEVTAYGAAWRRGATWPLPPNPVPIDYVTRAAALWRGGESYGEDPLGPFAPLWWVNGAATNGVSASLLTSTLPLGSGGPVVAGLAGPEAERWAPPVYVPGDPVPVTVVVTPSAGCAAYAVEEAVPTGWTVSAISPEGECDVVHGQVKWGPFLDGLPRRLSCTWHPPSTATGPVVLHGVASFDGRSFPIAGRTLVTRSVRLTIGVTGDGQRFLRLSGAARVRGVIEASSDWVTWSPVAEFEPAEGEDTRIVAVTGNGRSQFYRVRVFDP